MNYTDVHYCQNGPKVKGNAERYKQKNENTNPE